MLNVWILPTISWNDAFAVRKMVQAQMTSMYPISFALPDDLQEALLASRLVYVVEMPSDWGTAVRTRLSEEAINGWYHVDPQPVGHGGEIV